MLFEHLFKYRIQEEEDHGRTAASFRPEGRRKYLGAADVSAGERLEVARVISEMGLTAGSLGMTTAMVAMKLIRKKVRS